MYKHLDINVKEELEKVNNLDDFENVIDELASMKMSLLSVVCDDNELQDVRAELVHAMEYTVKWINERLESGYWCYDTCQELREQKYYLMQCLSELKYMTKYSIKVNFQIHEFGKRWEDTPVKTMTVTALNEVDCRGLAGYKMKELSNLEEKEIRYTINHSSQGHYVGHNWTFKESLRRKEQQQ
uniref:Uncharacterized protein n=1 Tax=Bacillus phage KoopaTroopa TaxID=3234046 RepID=A0AB39C7N2_9CAUD